MQPHRGIFQYNKIYQRVQALCIFNAQNLWALTLCCSCSSVLITYILHKSQNWCILTTVIELTRSSDHYGASTLEVLLQCSWHFKRCPPLQQQFATIAICSKKDCFSCCVNWKHCQRHWALWLIQHLSFKAETSTSFEILAKLQLHIIYLAVYRGISRS